MFELFFATVQFSCLVFVGCMWLCYAIGMAEYSRMNIVKNIDDTDIAALRREKERIVGHLHDELNELVEAMDRKQAFDVVLEAFDVGQLLIKYAIACHSLLLLENEVVWMVVFPIVFPTGIKLGWRYAIHRCVRNHKNVNNLSHWCAFR